MRSGDMDRRIVIQEAQFVSGPGGVTSTVWVTIATLWASMKQVSGREYLAAASIQSDRKVTFRIRWIDGITPVHRILYRGVEHDIHEVRELGRKQGIELHTTAKG